MNLDEIILLAQKIWPYLFLFVGLPLALWAAGHSILYKREVRASIGWVGVILLVPFLGPALYFMLGINRIQRKASRLLGERQRMQAQTGVEPVKDKKLEALLPPGFEHIVVINRLVEKIVKRPLLPGNRILPLLNGDVAYPDMLASIEAAQKSISLESYIFDNDKAGALFREALKKAVQRGVEVRILIDDVGGRYSWPPIHNKLRADGVNARPFLPTRVPWRAPYMNLRNHRKILVVDGKIGYTGGMNIREGHMVLANPGHPVQDLHFRVEGPVVAHLQEAFAEDWVFTTGEQLEGEVWFPPLEPCGESMARGIKDGPDEDFEKLRWAILGAIDSARHSIRVMTPYFLPDQTLITALNIAALRGIDVTIVLPEKNNLALVQWATNAHLWELLSYGCKLYASPPPFDHTKIMIVDSSWVLMGSANWDPRSFRLNFEFNVEIYDSVLAESLDDFVLKKIQRSKLLTLEENQARPLFVRLRDGLARLLTPYL